MAVTAFTKPGILMGCRNVVFCKITAEDAQATTYDSDVKSAPGVIEIALTPQTTEDQVGADDVPLYEIYNSADGYEVNLTLASLGIDGEAYLLGHTVDDNGALVENKDDVAPYVAMGLITARSDGSDDYIWLYRGKFSRGDSTFRTKEKGQVNWQTPTLKGVFAPRLDNGDTKTVLNSKDPKAAAALQTFFDEPYEKAVTTTG